MGKSLYIAEKPSVAAEFAKALKINGARRDGYMESEQAVVTWCVGHLVTMSYPEVYDVRLKRWSLQTLPFIPKEFKYEVIEPVKKQFEIVKSLLNRPDVETIYVCTDSGREGEYIYRLVEQMAGVKGKKRRRVWIDSQTEEEILKGIRGAKDLSEYDNLAASAYLRAKEDYLMGINFSRLLTLKYGNTLSSYLKTDRTVLSVGRVMTCVQGMVVRREREIRQFVKTPFYRVLAALDCQGSRLEAEWKAVEGSRYFAHPALYKENGFKEREKAEELIAYLSDPQPVEAVLLSQEKKQEKKNPPLLFNLAELQNECSKLFKLSPDETLKIVQELYEKKLVTYPRTDARVLSSAVSKEIEKNIGGLRAIPGVRAFAEHILNTGVYKGIAKTRYVNDKAITDHYAIIPTGQGINQLARLAPLAVKVYEVIVRRFLSIFLPPAVYQKYSLEFRIKEEHFFAGFKVLKEPGYLAVAAPARAAKEQAPEAAKAPPVEPLSTGKESVSSAPAGPEAEQGPSEELADDKALLEKLSKLRKGAVLPVQELTVKEGETSPPKRYTSGSIILAMENAGQLIEDEELRAQIKGSGIGTSATRAEILKKLVTNKYLALNQKTQVITPTLLGELIYDTVDSSLRQLLNPELTASWEKGLTYVAEGQISEEEYMVKLDGFIRRRTAGVLNLQNGRQLCGLFDQVKGYYEGGKKKKDTQA
ncbi:MAG: type IA DNA topoisomerase [Lachnospiraceae bacterium]|nr:type IA DNA topoisomerase [Lachnospiraceae bacterium]